MKRVCENGLAEIPRRYLKEQRSKSGRGCSERIVLDRYFSRVQNASANIREQFDIPPRPWTSIFLGERAR